MAAKKDISTSNAFESIAVRNDVMVHSEVIKLEKYYSDEIDEVRAKKRAMFVKFRDNFCGGETEEANKRIKAVQNRKKDEDDDSNSVSSDFSTESEAAIDSIIRIKERLTKLEGQAKKNDVQLKQYAYSS